HGAVIIRDYDVDRTVVINVAESCSAAHFGKGEGSPGDLGHVAELLSIALVAEQLIDLPEWVGIAAQRRHAVYRPVSDKHIEPTIVVVVKPFSTKSCKRERWLEQGKFRRRILEIPAAVVDIKIAAFMSQVGFEDVLVTIVVKIARCDTHASLWSALHVVRGP